jgi:hypothetical protein
LKQTRHWNILKRHGISKQTEWKRDDLRCAEIVFFDCHVAPQPGWHESFVRTGESGKIRGHAQLRLEASWSNIYSKW